MKKRVNVAGYMGDIPNFKKVGLIAITVRLRFVPIATPGILWDALIIRSLLRNNTLGFIQVLRFMYL